MVKSKLHLMPRISGAPTIQSKNSDSDTAVRRKNYLQEYLFE